MKPLPMSCLCTLHLFNFTKFILYLSNWSEPLERQVYYAQCPDLPFSYRKLTKLDEFQYFVIMCQICLHMGDKRSSTLN